MQSKWSEPDAARFVENYAPQWGDDLALRTYSARLLGDDPALVLHGGGNTSVKNSFTNVLGETVDAIFVKASGFDMATIEPVGHPALDLSRLRKLRALGQLTDRSMVNEIRARLFDSASATPSIETLVHAFIPPKFIDHTHADAILALTNQRDGKRNIEDALEEKVIVLDYVPPGFDLAKAAAAAYEARPECSGMVWMKHGIVTWGETARESYEAMIRLVSQAENYIALHAHRPLAVPVRTDLTTAEERWTQAAPVLRGLLARPSGEQDRPYHRVILQPLINRDVLDFVDSARGKELALSPPLTSDHLIRTKPLPLWIDAPDYTNLSRLREQLATAISAYATEYDAYVKRHSSRLDKEVDRFDPTPRVILLPGLGAVAAGKDVEVAIIARDITAHTLHVKAQVAAMEGVYEGLQEHALFEMEYRPMQQAKIAKSAASALAGEVALVTGAAGAIGSAIAEALLVRGCHVAVTDLPGERLDQLTRDLKAVYGRRVTGVEMDVTDVTSVKSAFDEVTRVWGGVDLVIVNAGAAMVCSLDEMTLEGFQRLERINIDGSLLVLAECSRHFKRQGTGGDIVMISTKNVFAPGARFGAYSATKAAAHQLARIASLEMAELDVRVNMVAPDAVFSHGARRSGLWAEVGPDRMKARGLSQDELEEYYRKRNLLKVKVTADHVARAVLFFATRQTPTTGATLPVDGGLPDATPR
ncbi:MAG TPA: bifunctional aldolase/short-chain dehydrogenase [Terriglobia bacterium]|nr:bifunctional aldolase/short-chain dehydrogenase [Terriglobia bacterium]